MTEKSLGKIFNTILGQYIKQGDVVATSPCLIIISCCYAL